MILEQEVAKCFTLNKIYKRLNEIYNTRIKWSILYGIISRWMMKEIGMKSDTKSDPLLPTGDYISMLISDLRKHTSVTENDEKVIHDIIHTGVRNDIHVGKVTVFMGTNTCKYSLSKPKIELSVPTSRALYLKKFLTTNEIFVLLLRYHTLNSLNNQLAITPELYNKLVKVAPIKAELFASALNVNSNTDMFCSLFPDIEKKCGSKGSFFSIIPPSGIYFANPPYDEEIMEEMAKKFHRLCQSDTEQYTFISLLPVWDKAGILKLKGVESKWGEFIAFKILSESPYCKKIITVEQSKAKFINYAKMEYIYPCNIYLVVLSNSPMAPIQKIVDTLQDYYGVDLE